MKTRPGWLPTKFYQACKKQIIPVYTPFWKTEKKGTISNSSEKVSIT